VDHAHDGIVIFGTVVVTAPGTGVSARSVVGRTAAHRDTAE
jgi:hypothetical protein